LISKIDEHIFYLWIWHSWFFSSNLPFPLELMMFCFWDILYDPCLITSYRLLQKIDIFYQSCWYIWAFSFFIVLWLTAEILQYHFVTEFLSAHILRSESIYNIFIHVCFFCFSSSYLTVIFSPYYSHFPHWISSWSCWTDVSLIVWSIFPFTLKSLNPLKVCVLLIAPFP